MSNTLKLSGAMKIVELAPKADGARAELVNVAASAIRAFRDTIRGAQMIDEVNVSSTSTGIIVKMRDGTEVHFDTMEL